MTIIFILLGIISLCIFSVLVLFTAADRTVLLGNEKTFTIDGNQRLYRIVVPKEVNQDTKVVVGLHGFGDTSRRFAYYTGLHNVMSDDIIVYPQALTPDDSGYKRGWNAGFCCGSGWVSQTDDAGFISALTKQITEDFSIDASRVFITGFSNGGFMAQRMVVEYPDQFAAAAIGSGSIGTVQNSLEPKTPVPILFMHGEQDTTVPFAGGEGSSDPDFTWRNFEETTTTWQQNNGDQAPVKIITHPEDGHRWHDWRLLNFWHKRPAASSDVDSFFSSF